MNNLKSKARKSASVLTLFALTLIFSAVTTRISAQTSGNNNNGGISGSIQTSDSSGTAVNENHFSSKADVYLNGGPQNSNSAGLPVGTYYFQVTTPSGDLLSTDPAVCRQLVVALNPSSGKGVVSGMAPFGSGANERPATCSATDHLNGTTNPVNGTTPVQLMPFNDTDKTGVYKVWLIRKTSNTVIAPDGINITGLNGRKIDGGDYKTDTFKVTPADGPPPPPEPNVTYTLSGCKFYDADADGVRDAGETGVQGVRIVVTINGATDADPIETAENGCWSRAGVAAEAEYFVQEIVPSTGVAGYYWVQTAPTEISIPDPNGMPGDILTVRAYQGTATGGTPVNDVVTIGGLDFGNLCFGPNTTGRTKGYWTNKNGENEMKSGTVDTSVYPTVTDNPLFPELGQGMNGDLNFLKRLNLKGEATVKQQLLTVDFDPATYGSFRTWLSSSNAYNMSYMLSAQLAASSLNVRHRRFGDGQIVDARSVCDSTGYCLGLRNIGNVRFLANESLGAAGGNITISGSAHRESQELMKNFLDAVNNNWLAFAQSSACPVVYEPVVVTTTTTTAVQ